MKSGYGLSMVYYGEPDQTEHEHGPDSEEVALVVSKIDSALGELSEALQREGLDGQVDVIVTGDHGEREVCVGR